MINPFNVSHSKVVNLRGTHHAATVFCHHVVKHEGDVHYAWLHCDELVELGDDFVVEPDTCNHDDRVYFGELLAIPTSRSRVADCDPDYDRFYGISSTSRLGNPLYRPL